uniref:Peroxidase n=1 Tax=Kalanchoe fedtschenkoi TaxID=63787 RepID=A0A7N0TXK4_KALFE
MAYSPLPLLVALISSALLPLSRSQLSDTYYHQTCPKFEQIVADIVTSKQISTPTTAAGALRLLTHDCFVQGCDASLLISSNAFNTAERDADINLSLPGDAFDVVVRAKTALELECPGVVSCADILALATRNLVNMVGGPFYKVPVGRKDGLVSQAAQVEGNLPRTSWPMTKIISFFAAKGFTVGEMVALTGAHTIGFSHCKEFADRIFNFSAASQHDPSLNPKYAERLRQMCASYKVDTGMSAFNDVMTPGKFDNMYFKNLKNGLGLLATDAELYADERTRPFVERYAEDQKAFFEDFAAAMEKLGAVGVKGGKEGEVRYRCDAFNTLKTQK